MLQLPISKLVQAYIKEQLPEDIKHLKDIEELGRKLAYENFLKESFRFFPEHKWPLLKFPNVYGPAFKKAFFHLKINRKHVLQQKSFDELITYIDSFNIPRFGELSTYDTALALSIPRRFMPDKVYLHAGPLKTAKEIYGNDFHDVVKYLHGNPRLKYLNPNDLPPEFDALKHKPWFIEDCLCYTYKHGIKPQEKG